MNTSTVKAGPFGKVLLCTLLLFQLALPSTFAQTSINDGPGGPILVIGSSANPFSTYPAEMLRAEGWNAFKVLDISNVTSTALNNYDVVILGDISLTAAQVTMLTNWTNSGGTLIAFSPDPQLASLMGITSTGGTLAEGYLYVNQAAAPGSGIVAQTMQYHGSADLYTVNAGTTVVATLFSSATSATVNPAVTVRNIGTAGGQAVAFTYDLAKSIVYTRQGNPAWAGTKRDNQALPIRSDDLFFPGWVDFNKIAIPQADEQQRLLTNIIISGNLDRKPLPHFWFLPKGLKAAVIETGDDHNYGASAARFDQYINYSADNSAASVANWTALRNTAYIYPGGKNFTDTSIQRYQNMGFEVALHLTTNCSVWTATEWANYWDTQWAQLKANFPSIKTPVTNRTHCISWSDWATQPKLESARGVRLDCNYYYWPGDWVNDRPGLFTGSGIPMRFADLDGSLIDCYQVTTQMTDESAQTYPKTITALLDSAVGAPGYYGVFCSNIHNDDPYNPPSDYIVAAAKARNVPVITAKQMLDWLDGKSNSTMSAFSWSNKQLSFKVTADTRAFALKGMLPTTSSVGLLTGITLNGAAVTFTRQTIKGVEYAFFDAVTGSFVATYAPDVTPPVISAVAATTNGDGTSIITWTTNEASDSRVDYGTASGTLNHNTSDAVKTTSHSITLAGLANTTKYYFRVTSKDASANSATSPATTLAPASFTIPVKDTIPPTISTIVATPNTSGTLVITWTTNEVATSRIDYGATSAALNLNATDNSLLTSHSMSISGLLTGTTYYFRVTSKDGSGNTTTSPTATAAPLSVNMAGPACPCNVFTSTPALNGPYNDGQAIMLGMKFRVLAAGNITGIRFIKDPANTGTHTGQLYNGNGTLLATVVFSGETASGWQTAMLSTPVAVVPNTTYIVAYHSSSGVYSAAPGYFTAAVDNGPLHALADGEDGPNGLYLYTANPAFPTNSFNKANYGVDVVFNGTPPADDTAPIVSNIVATPNANGTVTIAWTTDETSDSRVDFGAVSNTLNSNKTDSSMVTSHSITLNGFTANTTYYFRVTSHDPSGNTVVAPSTAGSPMSFTTPAAGDVTPPVISNVVAVTATGGLATITWTTNEASDSRVDYGISSSALDLNTSNANMVTSHSVMLSGLTSGTTFYFQVTSKDAAGNAATSPAASSAPLSFKMPVAVITICGMDDTNTNFSAGTLGTNLVSVLDSNGALTLKPLLSEDFTTTPSSGWAAANWQFLGSSTTVSGGLVTVNGSRAYTTTSFAAGASMEFSAKFTAEDYQQIGLSVNSSFGAPWVAIGRSGLVSGNGVYLMTSNGANVLLGNSLVNAFHRYKIMWTSTGFTAFVDGVQVATANMTITTPMVVQISDYYTGLNTVSVDWVRVSPYASSGTFTSRVIDAGSTTFWKSASWSQFLPTGTSITMAYRTGSTATPDGSWSVWTPVTNGGGLVGNTRYLQYQAVLATTDVKSTPSLKEVTFSCSASPTKVKKMTDGSMIDQTVPYGTLSFDLAQNIPNPARGSAIINYTVAKTTRVRISVWDMYGRLVKVAEEADRDPGKYSLQVDLHGLSKGVYLYRMEAGDFTATRKMILD